MTKKKAVFLTVAGLLAAGAAFAIVKNNKKNTPAVKKKKGTVIVDNSVKAGDNGVGFEYNYGYNDYFIARP